MPPMTVIPKVELTLLNSMAGRSVEEALDRHVEWGVRRLDLKDGLWGKAVSALTEGEAIRLKELAEDRELEVDCLSTGIFHEEVEVGEEAFRGKHAPVLENALRVARILRPRMFRLLAPRTRHRADLLDCLPYLDDVHAWVFTLFTEAVDRIADGDWLPVIENEVSGCLFSRPQEIIGFLERLQRPGRMKLIWDVQNLWQLGVYPSLETYRVLRPWIGSIHLKGGQAERPGGALVRAAGLRGASWPVLAICRAAVIDGVSPVFCLNPSHGSREHGYRDDPAGDLAFLRENIDGVA